MSLVLVRVDCRLIHGQIIEAWVPFTQANCVVVANDQAAEDHWQKVLMEMAVPPTVEVAVLKVEEAAVNLAGGRWATKRVILLFANCHDAWSSYRAGLKITHLNLGNLSCAPGKKQVTSTLSLDARDLECLVQFRKQGIEVEARLVPRDHSLNLKEIMDIGSSTKA